MSSDEAYSHPWIKANWSKLMPTIPISESVPNQIQKFLTKINLKRSTIIFMASRIPEDQLEDLKKAFIKLDVNGDGILTKSELVKGVKEHTSHEIKDEEWD